jgi:hypothetical protein
VPFANPIVAGEDLVRPAIHSPDYVSGSAGWIVSADGTAEFSDVAIRGEFAINGPFGRSIRGYVSIADIPVLDFTPIAPTTPGWTVSNGSIYEYADAGCEVLGLSSPVQYQPADTGEALLELRSGSAVDPTPVVRLIADLIELVGTVVITGSLTGVLTVANMPYLHGQRGQMSVTASGAPTATQAVVFPVSFPTGAAVQVFCNIIGSAAGTGRCHIRAINITVNGFTLFVESPTAAVNLAWTSVPVGWLAVDQ